MTRRLPFTLAAASAVALLVVACTDSHSPVAPRRSVLPVHLDVTTDTISTTTDTTSSIDTTAVAGPIVAADTVPTVTVMSLVPPPTQLLYCPTTDRALTRAVIGPEGGSVGARGSVLTLPPGAVDSPTEFEVEVPASEYMEVNVHAVGHESFQFLTPAYISINFARCPSLPAETLQAVYIDGTRTILEVMGVGADHINKKVVFATPHLSGYAIAWGADTTTITQ